MPRLRLAALVLLIALLASTGDAGAPAPPPDQDLLQGTWQIASVLRDGEPDPTQIGGTVVFSGDGIAFVARAPQVMDFLS